MATSETAVPELQAFGSESMSTDGSEVSSPMNSTIKKTVASFKRSDSSFLRVSDLDLDAESCSITSEMSGNGRHPNFHSASIDPPPGVAIDEKEKWVALNDGSGTFSPIAPLAFDKLHDFGLSTIFDNSMWTPDKKTNKLMKRIPSESWMNHTFTSVPLKIPEGEKGEDILVWNGSFQHKLYGSDLPAIRVAGIINMAPKEIFDLLVDSSRTKEYNKMSLGREDLIIFQEDLKAEGPFGRSVAKVTRSASKPPMVRKHMVFTSCIHGKELEDGSGYMICSRAVHYPKTEQKNIIKSEMLLGINMIRKIEGCDNKCVMVNVNHMRSPMVPMVVAKKLGLLAAVGFIKDMRSAC